jgi:hypothetical protein
MKTEGSCAGGQTWQGFQTKRSQNNKLPARWSCHRAQELPVCLVKIRLLPSVSRILLRGGVGVFFFWKINSRQYKAALKLKFYRFLCCLTTLFQFLLLYNIEWMFTNNEYTRIWKEEVGDCLKVLSQHSLRKTEESHENPRSGQTVVSRRFELDTSRIWIYTTIRSHEHVHIQLTGFVKISQYEVRFQVLTAADVKVTALILHHVIQFIDLYLFSCRPDDGGRKRLWNVGKLLSDYTAQHPRRQSWLSQYEFYWAPGVFYPEDNCSWH